MADVQIAVGLRREAGADARLVQRAGGMVGRVARRAGKTAAGEGASLEVVLDALAQEVRRRRDGCSGGGGLAHHRL